MYRTHAGTPCGRIHHPVQPFKKKQKSGREFYCQTSYASVIYIRIKIKVTQQLEPKLSFRPAAHQHTFWIFSGKKNNFGQMLGVAVCITAPRPRRIRPTAESLRNKFFSNFLFKNFKKHGSWISVAPTIQMIGNICIHFFLSHTVQDYIYSGLELCSLESQLSAGPRSRLSTTSSPLQKHRKQKTVKLGMIS